MYGRNFDIKSARRVGKTGETIRRDILIHVESLDDKFFILYNQTQSNRNMNNILNFDIKIENLAY